MTEQTLSKEQVEEAIQDIDKLAKAEYGLTLEQVLAVNLAVILTKFGYEKFTNPPSQPDP